MSTELLLKELVTSQVIELETCVRCGACSEACPVYEQDKSILSVPALKLQELRKIAGRDISIFGLISPTSRVNVDELRKASEAAYLCTLCGRCWVGCILGIRNRELREVLRSIIYKAKFIPEPLRGIDASLMKYKNPYDASRRLQWIDKSEVEVPVNVRNARTLFFVGCTSAVNGKAIGIARSTAYILNSLGESWTVLGEDEWCCGGGWVALGNRDMARNFAIHNVRAIESLGVRRVVTSCAECYRMLKWEYPEMMVRYSFEVLHISELVNRYLNEGKLKFSRRVLSRITYHDPCSLSRLGGIINEPRNILKNIVPREASFNYLIEMPENKMDTYCCGGGGFLKYVHPDLTLKIATHRVKQAEDVGAGILVSACPICKTTFTDAVKKLGKGLKILDLTELIAESI